MLELGASPNYRDNKNLTPLYHLSKKRNSPALCAELLLRDYAHLGCKDDVGNTELHQVAIIYFVFSYYYILWRYNVDGICDDTISVTYCGDTMVIKYCGNAMSITYCGDTMLVRSYEVWSMFLKICCVSGIKLLKILKIWWLKPH